MKYTINDLMCGFVSLSYDGDSLIGSLHLPPRHCCDMRAAVGLFTQIDPNVKRIETFSGATLDTVYQKSGKEWLVSPCGWAHQC